MKGKLLFFFALLLMAACDNKFDWIKPPIVKPVVDSLAPDTGTAGTPVIITGSNFSEKLSDNQVTINGTTATITHATASQLIFIAPHETTGRCLPISSIQKPIIFSVLFIHFTFKPMGV